MNKIYMCIDLKSFYASVECRERNLDPNTTNLVVTKGREDIVESLENLNFSKEETNLYCIMKNF